MICWQNFRVTECFIDSTIALTAVNRQFCSFKCFLSRIFMESVAAYSDIAITECCLFVLCKTAHWNVRPNLSGLDNQLVLCSLLHVWLIIINRLLVRLVGVWLSQIWKNPTVQTNVVLFHMILLLCAVEENAKPRELLEPFCMPAWPSLSHLVEDIVDKGCSWVVHPLSCRLVSFVFAFNDSNHLSIGLLFEDEPICTNSYMIWLIWNISLLWCVFNDT